MPERFSRSSGSMSVVPHELAGRRGRARRHGLHRRQPDQRVAWGVGVTVAGYLLGKSIPSVDCLLLPIIVLVVVLRKGRPDAADRVSMSV
jgi:hypothetical protein